MTISIRNAHGTGDESDMGAVVEVVADELTSGIAEHEEALAGPERGPNGWLLQGGKNLQRKGGKARRQRVTASMQSALDRLAADPAAAPFFADVAGWRRAQILHLGSRVGGGEVGPDVQRVVHIAAMQASASDFYFSIGDFEKGSKLGAAAAQTLVKAHALCAAAAKARQGASDPLATYRERMDAVELPEDEEKEQ